MDNNLKQHKSSLRRKRLLLLLTFIITIISFVLGIIIYLKVKSDLSFMLIAIILIGLFIMILYAKPKVMYYTLMESYFKLLVNSEKPYNIKEEFSNEWLTRLRNEGFKTGLNNDKFVILYRIISYNKMKLSESDSILEIITLFRDNNEFLYSDNLDEEYKKIWMNTSKRYSSKQIIIQIKKYDNFNDEYKEKLDQIISFKEKRNVLVTINCGYFPNEKNNFYFLHSNEYYPNKYYKIGCDLIKKYIK